MLKLFSIGTVVMLVTLASRSSEAVSGGGGTCNTICTDSHGNEYWATAGGSSVDEAYQNLHCQGGDTIGEINCYLND